MATKKELQAQADQEIEDAKPINKSVDGVTIEFSEEDYAQAKIDLGNSKWNEQQFGYIALRQSAYKSIPEQLDMQYWDSVNDTTEWNEHIAEVKAAYPKPE